MAKLLKRTFNNSTEYLKDFILENHNLNSDFNDQDCKINKILNKNIKVANSLAIKDFNIFFN